MGLIFLFLLDLEDLSFDRVSEIQTVDDLSGLHLPVVAVAFYGQCHESMLLVKPLAIERG